MRSRRNDLASVVVPTDFSPGTTRAVERAAYLRIAAKGRIHLAHVLPKGVPDRDMLEQEARRRLAHAASTIERRARAVRLEAPAMELSAMTGEPYVEMCGAAPSSRPYCVASGSFCAPARCSREVCIRERRTFAGLGARPSRSFRWVRFTGYGSGLQLASSAMQGGGGQALAAQVESLERRGFELSVALRHSDARTVILNEAQLRGAHLIALGTHARSGLAYALLEAWPRVSSSAPAAMCSSLARFDSRSKRREALEHDAK